MTSTNAFRQWLIKLLFPLIRPYKTTIPQKLSLFLLYSLRPHRWNYLVVMACGLVWSFYVSFMPYFTKRIVDAVANNSDNMDAMVSATVPNAIAFLCLYLAVNASYRTRDYAVLKALPLMQRHIFTKLSSHLKRHSHRYFQERMAGDLANKVSDLVRGARSILEMCETFFMQGVAIIIAIFMMYSVHPYFAAILFGWSVFFLGLTIFLSKTSQRHARAFSESRSRVSGREKA